MSDSWLLLVSISNLLLASTKEGHNLEVAVRTGEADRMSFDLALGSVPPI